MSDFVRYIGVISISMLIASGCSNNREHSLKRLREIESLQNTVAAMDLRFCEPEHTVTSYDYGGNTTSCTCRDSSQSYGFIRASLNPNSPNYIIESRNTKLCIDQECKITSDPKNKPLKFGGVYMFSIGPQLAQRYACVYSMYGFRTLDEWQREQ